MPCRLPNHSVQVLVLQMTCKTDYGSKFTALLPAATYSSSRFSCTMFRIAFVTDCKHFQFSFELMWNQQCPFSTASSYSSIYIFHLYMAHASVSTNVVYCLQSKFPNNQSVNITVHCTKNEKTVTIQLCISIHHQTMTGQCIMNWNLHGKKWSWPV